VARRRSAHHDRTGGQGRLPAGDERRDVRVPAGPASRCDANPRLTDRAERITAVSPALSVRARHTPYWRAWVSGRPTRRRTTNIGNTPRKESAASLRRDRRRRSGREESAVYEHAVPAVADQSWTFRICMRSPTVTHLIYTPSFRLDRFSVLRRERTLPPTHAVEALQHGMVEWHGKSSDRVGSTRALRPFA
jgi:hypothetical protein